MKEDDPRYFLLRGYIYHIEGVSFRFANQAKFDLILIRSGIRTARSASLTAPDLAVQALRAVGCEAFAVGGCQLIEDVILFSSIAGIIYSPFGRSHY
ncbi:hypothetical protein BJ138DRAFT_1165473, partial [Hygrophoropsis aurantiaca]